MKVVLSGQEVQTREAGEMWPDRSDGKAERDGNRQGGC